MISMDDIDRIKLSHGAGGKVMQELISSCFMKHLGRLGPDLAGSKLEVPLTALDDGAVIDDIVLTTDSHTVKPLFFPGGDIGSLSVAGTVNDVSVMGADPLALSLAMVIENGFPLDDLERVIRSVAETCRKAEVPVITGDTKVMENGAVEKMVVNTSGIGRRSEGMDHNLATVREYRKFESRWLMDSTLAEGDRIIVSGTVGDHGIALLSHREGYRFESEIVSDVCPLNKVIGRLLKVGGVVSMKDPTRGGLANTLNEISEKSGVGIMVEEESIPLSIPVISACEMLGLDPLEIGNEGKVVIGVVPDMAEEVLGELKKWPEGKNAAIIGEATRGVKDVVMRTVIGGKRMVEAPIGDPIPRIC